MAIVEGHGEVSAVPILLRRIAAEVSPSDAIDVPRPIRIKRQRILREGELERAIELAARQSGEAGAILVLVDADDDCPAELGPILLARARAARPDREIRVVVAKPEYEAWFLASARSLAGHRGISASVAAPADPELEGHPKAWLSRQIGAERAYRETLDQPALTAVMDLSEARRAQSFDKLWRDVVQLVSACAGLRERE